MGGLFCSIFKEVAQKKRKPATVVKRREEQPAGDKPMKSLRGSTWLKEERDLTSVCYTEVFPELGSARLGSEVSFVSRMSA